MFTDMKIQVILGSVREGRFGDKPAHWIMEELKKREGVEAELIDLKDWPLPMFNEPMSPGSSGGKYTNPLGEKFAKKIGEADGYIFTVAEYNHGYTAVLKNALDWVYAEWNKKPVSFVSYGGISAGTRSVQQLREVVLELQMVPLRNAVHIPMAWTMTDENGKLKINDHITSSGNSLIDQLLMWAKDLKVIRK